MTKASKARAADNPRLWDLILAPEGLATLFQPVFEVRDGRRTLFAFEALTRGPRGSGAERPDVLFDYVRRKRGEVAVDRLAIAASLREARFLPSLPGLSLNVHAATLDREARLPSWLADMAAEYEVPPAKLILEIVEHHPVFASRQLVKNLDRLRALGIRIALDDVGLGQATLAMIVECRPDYLKIDRHFVHGAHLDPARRAVLASLSDLAGRLNARAVAEGIEDANDLAVILAAGIDLAQGFLLCRPAPALRLKKLLAASGTA